MALELERALQVSVETSRQPVPHLLYKYKVSQKYNHLFYCYMYLLFILFRGDL